VLLLEGILARTQECFAQPVHQNYVAAGVLMSRRRRTACKFLVTMLLKFSYEFPKRTPRAPTPPPPHPRPAPPTPAQPAPRHPPVHTALFGLFGVSTFEYCIRPPSVQNRCLGIKEVCGNHVMEAGSKKNLVRAIGPLELGGP
jgi:hypothetical protein